MQCFYYSWLLVFVLSTLLIHQLPLYKSQTHFLDKLKGREEEISGDKPSHSQDAKKESEYNNDDDNDDDDDDDRMSFMCQGIDEEQERAMIAQQEIKELEIAREAARKLIEESEEKEKLKRSKSKRPESSIRETIDIKVRLQETERRLDALLKDQQRPS